MKVFPGFDRIYELYDPLGNRAFRGQFVHTDGGFELSRHEQTVSTPVEIRWAMGTAVPQDVIWTTSAHPLIVSARVIELLRAHEVTGWTTFPVHVVDKCGLDHESYFGLAVTGRCGAIDLWQSAIALRQMPGGLFPDFVGHYFDPDTWDGSDICVPVRDSQGQASSRRVVTERVLRLLKKHRVSNLRGTRLCEARFSTANYEIGLQHLLPRDFGTRIRKVYEDAGVVPPDRYRDIGDRSPNPSLQRTPPG